MKNVLKIVAFLSTLNANAQTVSPVTTDFLAETRVSFNKKLIRKNLHNIEHLPCSEYLFAQPGKNEVKIEGLTFLTSDHLIIGIKGIGLSDESLIQINERLVSMDRLQYAYSEASNQEYRSGQKNNYNIVLNDRRFFAVLRAIKATSRDIKKICESNLSATEKSDALVKIRPANVNLEFYSRIYQAADEKMLANKRKE